jgi:hypothetical protein
VANIKDIAASSDKWQRRAAVAGPDYQSGVQNPRVPWAAAAQAADANYRAGVTAAASAGRFASGVKAAGDERWSKNAIAKGPSRYAEGVSLAVDRWQRGFQPFQDGIRSLQLPARGPKGSPQNLNRVSAVANLARQIKERMGK